MGGQEDPPFETPKQRGEDIPPMRDSPCQVFLEAGHRAVQKPRPWDERDEQDTVLCWRLFAALQIDSNRTIFAQSSVAIDVGIDGSGRVEQQVLVISPCRGIPEID